MKKDLKPVQKPEQVEDPGELLSGLVVGKKRASKEKSSTGYYITLFKTSLNGMSEEEKADILRRRDRLVDVVNSFLDHVVGTHDGGEVCRLAVAWKKQARA